VAASTSATVVPGTNLIEVDVSDLSAKVARRLADAVSNAFVAQVSHYQSGTTAGQGQVPNEPAYVFQDATTASASSSGVTKKVLLGALFVLVISILLILLLDYLDISIKSPEELERRVGLPVLGIIPSFSSLQLDNIRTGSLPRTSNG
jgi:succinoglycan biosynthesis transport protein ExoP